MQGRKRANSLAEALQQYDAKTEQERRAELERLDRQLQADLDRFNREQQIRREADEQFNQAMHRLRVEKEQRRQTEELERIRKELERYKYRKRHKSVLCDTSIMHLKRLKRSPYLDSVFCLMLRFLGNLEER